VLGIETVSYLGTNLTDEELVDAEHMAVLRIAATHGGFDRVRARSTAADGWSERRALCHRCGRFDHTTRVCTAEVDVRGTPLRERLRQVDGVRWKGGCARCGASTHLSGSCFTHHAEWL
jgi:hypothetical protein